MPISLEKIEPTHAQIVLLYKQLKGRTYNVSHERVPTFREHTLFVKKHPYREWFMIIKGKSVVGNLYVQYDNSIALNSVETLSANEIKVVLELVSSLLHPLHPIPSVRYKEFFLNIASENTEMQEKLVSIGYKETQRSFVHK